MIQEPDPLDESPGYQVDPIGIPLPPLGERSDSDDALPSVGNTLEDSFPMFALP